MLGVKVQKQVAGVAIPGFDNRLAQTANDRPVTCCLSFAVSLETEVRPHGRAGVWFGHNAFCTAFTTHLVIAQSRPRGTLINYMVYWYTQIQRITNRYSLRIAVYQNIDISSSTNQKQQDYSTSVFITNSAHSKKFNLV